MLVNQESGAVARRNLSATFESHCLRPISTRKQITGSDMSTNRFGDAVRDLRRLPDVIQCVTWSDSVSVRYSGPLFAPKLCAYHDLYPRNIDGVLYADPMPAENDAGETIPEGDPDPPSVVAEEDSAQSAHLVEQDGDQRLLVTTTGVNDALGFMELDGPYGWMLTEAKEAQIRFAPPMSGGSYLLSRSTSQLRHLE